MQRNNSLKKQDESNNNLLKGTVTVEERFFLYLLCGFITMGDTEQFLELYAKHFEEDED